MALLARSRNRLASHVDVSSQAAVALLADNPMVWWFAKGIIWGRHGDRKARGSQLLGQVFPCKDGRIVFGLYGGRYGRLLRGLVDWMIEEGADQAQDLGSVNWDDLDLGSLSQVEIVQIESAFQHFFLRYTKAELLRGALHRGIALLPEATIAETFRNPIPRQRGFWVSLGPSVGDIEFAGPPAKCQNAKWTVRSTPPRVGQQNAYVFRELIGLTDDHLQSLQLQGVI